MRKRNTGAFTFLAWTSFVLSIGFIVVGIWNADWELVEKGFYAASMLWCITSAFVLAKVIRDNEEDRETSEKTKFRKEEDL